jgi:hypothetical protein
MEMTGESLSLADPSAGRISTTCNQRVRTHNLMRYHYGFIWGDATVTPVENSAEVLTIFYASFRTVNFNCFLSYSSQSYMLLNDTSRPTFNVISHE